MSTSAVSLAPDHYDTEKLPEPLVEDGSPVSLSKAGEIYGKCVGSRHRDSNSSKINRHCEKFGRYQGADRLFQKIFDLTTVMLTFRLSPTVGDLRVPSIQLDEMLHQPRKSVMNALNHALDGFTWEWIAVTAATDRWETPHIHMYLWISDTANEISTEMFKPAIDKHVELCQTASMDGHQYQDAISVQYEQDLTECPWSTDDEHGGPVTSGCKYVAQQLAHLPWSRPDEISDNELQTGALSWASSYQWSRSSDGVVEKV
jgi:hypothetical protein